MASEYVILCCNRASIDRKTGTFKVKRAAHPVFALFLSMLATAAHAADRATSDCSQTRDPDRTIYGCTFMLNRGDLPPRVRAMVLGNRASAFQRKRDMGHAMADFEEATRADPTFAKIFYNRALAYQAMGDLDRALADDDAAIKLDPSDASAFTNRGNLWAKKGEPARAIDDLSQAIRIDPKSTQAYVDLAVTLFNQGQKAQAMATIEDALRVQPRNRQLAEVRGRMLAMGVSDGPGSSKPSNEPATSSQTDESKIDDTMLYTRVRTLLKSGQYREGLRLANLFLDHTRVKFGADSVKYAEAVDLTVQFHRALNQYKESASAYESEISIYSKIQQPNNPGLLEIRGNLAQVYEQLSRYDEAQAILNDVLAIREATPGTQQDDIAWTLYNLAGVEMYKADFIKSEALDKRALSIWQPMKPESRDVTGALDLLASDEKKLNNPQQAEAIYQQVIAILEKTKGPDNIDIAGTTYNLALLDSDQGRYAEAESLLKRTLTIFEKAFGPDDPNVAQTLTLLGSIYSVQRRDHEAEAVFNRALVVQEKALGETSGDLASTLVNLGGLLMRQNRAAEAEKLYARSLIIIEKTLGPNHPNYAIVLSNLAGAVDTQGRGIEAQHLYERALAIDRGAAGSNPSRIAGTLHDLGSNARDAGRLDEAETLYSQSVAAYDAASTFDVENMVRPIEDLALIEENKGNFNKANDLLVRAAGSMVPSRSWLELLLARSPARRSYPIMQRGQWADRMAFRRVYSSH